MLPVVLPSPELRLSTHSALLTAVMRAWQQFIGRHASGSNT
jgi:hypothetical protein